MGTNFYWRVQADGLLPTGEEPSGDHHRPTRHLGKRSAAGPYCWDCNITLCKEGKDAIHHSTLPPLRPDEDPFESMMHRLREEQRRKFHQQCPRCGREPSTNGHQAAAVELGFQPPAYERPRGVRGAASFSWAQDPKDVEAICRRHPEALLVEDEYGREMTGGDFLAMLVCNCPIQYTDSLGTVFC